MSVIITADERLAQDRTVNIALFAPSGAGKTFQARTLDPETTLFVNLEGGDLSLGTWGGDQIMVRAKAAEIGCHPWELCRALACLMAGADPAAAGPNSPKPSPYSSEMHAQYVAAVGDPAQFNKYKTVFWDSITVAGRYSFGWSQTQQGAVSERTGKYDGRGAYGVHGQEVIEWLTTIQHIPGKSTVVVGILNSFRDDFNQVVFEPQIEGSKAGRELPGIFDEVLTLGLFSINPATGAPELDYGKGEHRAFVTQQNNAFGVPAKDRSGVLDAMEPPDLGKLIEKVQSASRQDKPILVMPGVGGEPIPEPQVQPLPDPTVQPEAAQAPQEDTRFGG